MAGYSDEIQADAEKAIMLPKARTDGEDYSDVSGDEDDDESGEDESMNSDDDDGRNEQEDSDESSADDGPKVNIAKNKSSRL